MYTKEKKKQLKSLFTSFLKTGALTFGGGLSMLGIIQDEMVEKKHWIRPEEMLEIIVIAESTPGPIIINSATFIGYKIGGKPGAFLATLGAVLPSYIIVTLIALVFNSVTEYPIVQYALFGIRAGVLALVFNALTNLSKGLKKNLLSYIIILSSLLALTLFKLDAKLLILFCILFGCLRVFLQQKKVKK